MMRWQGPNSAESADSNREIYYVRGGNPQQHLLARGMFDADQPA